MTPAQLSDEVVRLAQELIRVDTSNPPGRETHAAKVLADYLRRSGVEPELVGPDPERLNLVARVEGRGEGPSLMFLAHTDVVPAPPEGWSVDPFAGVVRDGKLVGRGATDMKNELAARAVAFAAIAREPEAPAGDLVLVAESDEERNISDVGMSWLVRERPDLRCDLALNEGGGTLLELADGRRVITASIGEKLVSALRVRVHGTAGHASVPEGADNAVGHAAEAIRRLLAARAPARVTEATAHALAALDAPIDNADHLIEWARELNPILGDEVAAITRLTVTPTGTNSYEPSNVIPPYVDVTCDCRALPGQDEGDIHEHVAAALGDDLRYELELLEPLVGGTQSTTDSPLYAELEAYVADRAPGAILLPLINAGFTDSHWIRSEFGTVAYGFAPQLHGDPAEYLEAAHADDEAIAVEDLVEMAELHLRVALTLGYPHRV